MSKKKEEIDLNISTEVSDDEFEDDFDETLTEDNENEEQEDNNLEENNEGELDEDSINENFENDEDELNNKKLSLEDSITKSELEKNTLTDTFLDDDDDDDIIDEDDTEIVDPNYEMNTILQVPDEERLSRNILTKYEIVRIIGTRAKQISDGSKVFVKYDGNKSAIELAELELRNKMIPLKIKRPLPNGKYEIWKLSELELLDNI